MIEEFTRNLQQIQRYVYTLSPEFVVAVGYLISPFASEVWLEKVELGQKDDAVQLVPLKNKVRMFLIKREIRIVDAKYWWQLFDELLTR
ncbi:hypothetical protein A1F94_004481 [Pyrenophora tritici-repentis]|uniref:Uncharacterized protein n=1 Tax=Pyrenophora tritici-repentis TaxID=45151 RepID=A0A2W1DZJ9_9PLEO|nr:hypothetical protein PtrV1_07100 [Pyrenophora tritici-repentis]KAF7448162.1 hypothetical protein A1F99_075260 [Pyrenophora tritici-repentis]KAF7571873.1 hypothetical protein PtrM4_093730 [Pyrenophora tritici-repentis]KAG9384934.1 hypothetical protein A1F94_004481 [Pyrenophora tritici-repentis]KAI1578516.1 hypothetical protein PtrEW13061_010329 [Pyrenophora tritici-repentis]